MKFTLEIDMENEAFGETNNGYEVARILRGVVNNIEERELTPNNSGGNLRDINGNKVGSWDVEE